MRTMILVLAMMALAAASGLSFVLPAAGQALDSAELEFGCGERIVVASFEPTLLTCTAEARNTGSTMLRSAQLEFLPAANVPPPDFYMFWSETRDGERSIPGPAGTVFDLGDVAPGGVSVIELEIIVRSSRDFGADVVLVAKPDQREYARTTVAGVTAEGASTVPATLTRTSDVATSSNSATYHLKVMNLGSAPYDSVTSELSPSGGTDVTIISDDWTRSGETGRFTVDFGELAGGTEIERDLTFAATQGCMGVLPVLLITVVDPQGRRREPVIGEPAPIGVCDGPSVEGLTLPQGGSGPAGGARPGILLAVGGLAAVGALCIGMGLTMRRRSRF